MRSFKASAGISSGPIALPHFWRRVAPNTSSSVRGLRGQFAPMSAIVTALREGGDHSAPRCWPHCSCSKYYAGASAIAPGRSRSPRRSHRSEGRGPHALRCSSRATQRSLAPTAASMLTTTQGVLSFLAALRILGAIPAAVSGSPAEIAAARLCIRPHESCEIHGIFGSSAASGSSAIRKLRHGESDCLGPTPVHSTASRRNSLLHCRIERLDLRRTQLIPIPPAGRPAVPERGSATGSDPPIILRKGPTSPTSPRCATAQESLCGPVRRACPASMAPALGSPLRHSLLRTRHFRRRSRSSAMPSGSSRLRAGPGAKVYAPIPPPPPAPGHVVAR